MGHNDAGYQTVAKLLIDQMGWELDTPIIRQFREEGKAIGFVEGEAVGRVEGQQATLRKIYWMC
ncbi:MAG: hypothetical protein HC837_03930 [Chloroflexaceae bacterium]|nr:hypothetical protein [Chloroflexaceae bacterium]